ncbi:MAG: hypothetical protein K0S75_1669, partial [Clostridia bacterium]|nr:hypothetical protein [Clostridia bacterium]
MKYLYELNLNNKKLIMSSVANLCDKDAYICSGCASSELRDSIIHLLSGTIIDTIENHCICTDNVCNIDVGIIKSFLISGIEIKFLMAI